MTGTILKPHTFFAETTASVVSSWYPVDYRYSGENLRTVVGVFSGTTATSSDEVILELKVSAGSDSVISTATAWIASAASTNGFSTVVTGPYTEMRVRKTGTTTGAKVLGVV